MRTGQLEQAVLAEAFVAAPGVSLEQAVGEQHQARARGQFHLRDGVPVAGVQAERGAAGRLEPLHRAVPVQQHARDGRPGPR